MAALMCTNIQRRFVCLLFGIIIVAILPKLCYHMDKRTPQDKNQGC